MPHLRMKQKVMRSITHLVVAAVACLMLLAFKTTAKAQRSFRFATSKVGQVEFLLPPHTKIDRRRQRYQRVIFENLSHYLFDWEKSADKALHEGDRKAITPTRLMHSYDTHTRVVNICSGASLWYSDDSTKIIIEVDYGIIFKDGATKEDVKMWFKDFALNLIGEIQSKEKQNQWPNGGCQLILKNVLAYIPCPGDLSLLGFAGDVSDKFSYVLLSPEISMKVDAVQKIFTNSDQQKINAALDSVRKTVYEVEADLLAKHPLDEQQIKFRDSAIIKRLDNLYQPWEYSLIGSTEIRFLRTDTGGLFQTPFVKFHAFKTLPSNYTNLNELKSLQASTVDVQLSGATSTAMYLILYVDAFKRNNSNVVPPGTGCAGYDDDPVSCNAFIVHTDLLSVDFDKVINRTVATDANVTKSSFGSRNFITPQIHVFVGSERRKVDLNSSVLDLMQQKLVTYKVTVKRQWRGKYRTVRDPRLHLILMPNDKLHL